MCYRCATKCASDRADESGDESAFDRLADAKADAIDAVLDHGSDQDRLRVLALLAKERHWWWIEHVLAAP